MIHDGIKSNNILLNFDSYPDIPNNGNLPPKLTFNQKSLNKLFTVKIADLGYTKDLLKNSEGSITNDDKEHKKYNNSLGLWSLGVITYEMLTGSAPFSENSFKEDFKNIKKGIKYFPKILKPSIEIISFLNGLLNYYPEKRLNWKQINSHPFLTKNPNEFTYIDLETITEIEQEKIEINSYNSDNHLWVFFKCKNGNMNIGKLNEEEVKKQEIKQMIDKNKVINEEVKKALEQEKIQLEEEKEKMKKIAEMEMKGDETEKINHQKKLDEL